MPSRRPKYTYERRGILWIVYRNEYTGNICEGTPIAECHSKEEARDMIYQLNGWNLAKRIKKKIMEDTKELWKSN